MPTSSIWRIAGHVLASIERRPDAARSTGDERALSLKQDHKPARVAVARKLAVILHRMWMDGTDFRWSSQEATQQAA
jgi:hypothetical protein